MRPFLAALGTIVLLGAVVFFVFFFRATVKVTATPTTAKISVDGQGASGRGTFRLWPGTHLVTIEEEGHIPFKRSEKLNIGQRVELTVELLAIPEAQTLSQNAVSLVGATTDKESVLFLGGDGKTLFSRTDGEEKALTPAAFDNPIFLKMSPTQDIAVLKKQNGDIAIHDFKRYDLVAQEQFFYGRDIGAIDWVYPEGEKLLYTLLSGSGERSLILADRTNKSLERVLNLIEAGITDPAVAVAPDGKTALLITRPGNDFGKYNMYLFDLFTKRAKQLTTDGSKVDARFSPNGTRILYSRFEQDPDGLNNQLISTMDIDGRNRKDFDLRATLGQVDFLDDTKVVVAATEKSGDRLYRIDLASGEIIKFYHKIISGIHFSKIAIVGNGDFVYAVGGTDPKEKRGTLYKIELVTDEYE